MGSLSIPVGPVTVDLIDDDRICQHVKREGSFEPKTLAAWARMVRPGSEVIDVGAYSGLFAIAAAKLWARVVAIEPLPAMADRLRENARLNGVKLTVIQAAASDTDGRALLGFTDVYLTSGASLARKSGNKLKVRTVALDSLRVSDVSAIKIDVEREELRVLAGAKRLLARERPSMVIEVLSDYARDCVKAAVLQTHRATAVLDRRNLILEPR